MTSDTTTAPAAQESKETAQAADGDRRSQRDDSALERRQKKIHEYLDEANGKLSPLEANLAFVNADLMTLAAYFRQDVDEVRSVVLDPKERLEWLYPVTEQVYKISKQIHSVAQTMLRLERGYQRPARDEEKLPTPKTPLQINSKDWIAAEPADPSSPTTATPTAVEKALEDNPSEESAS